MKKSKTILKITSIVILILSICCVLVALSSLFFGVTTATNSTTENSVSITQQTIESTQTSSELPITIANNYLGITMLVFAVIGFVLFAFGIKCVKGGSYKPAFTLGTTCLLLSCFYCAYSFENINIFNVISIIILGLYTRCAYGVNLSYNSEKWGKI